MPQMTPGGARVIDPILSTVARGYKNAAMVGGALFPTVPVTARGGKILTFGKEDFMTYATARAPGAATRRVQYGYAGSSYALESHSLEGVLPVESLQEAQAVPGVDLASVTVHKTQNIIALRKEQQQATLATTAGNYASGNKVTLSGTSQWSDTTNGVADPVKDVETGKEAVRAKIGLRPNTGIMSASVFAALKVAPKIIDRIKYTGRDVPTLELLRNLFGLDRLEVGDAVQATDGGVFSDVWGKFFVLAYTTLANANDMGTPSYGYTYQLGGYPIVESPYLDRNTKSWIYPVTDEVAPVIAGAEAGYLISAVIA